MVQTMKPTEAKFTFDIMYLLCFYANMKHLELTLGVKTCYKNKYLDILTWFTVGEILGQWETCSSVTVQSLVIQNLCL